jgi:hypothetical protein
MTHMNTGAGKGDSPRKVNGERYRNNYNQIFQYKQVKEMLFDLKRTSAKMMSTGEEMQAIDNDDIQRHGRELCQGAEIANGWIEHISEKEGVSVEIE